MVSGVLVLMGIVTAEALYPGAYRTDVNTISDLGGTRPPDSVVLQPSATIFDVVMVVSGTMIIVAALLLRRASRAAMVFTALLGLGVLGVGRGVVALVALAVGLFLLDWGPVAELGEGGIERWVAYPIVLWLVGLGGHIAR
jgi:hypothetical membrane protein